MTHPYIRVEVKGTYTQWTIDRPRRGNGLGPTIAGQLTVLLENFTQQERPNHALVITASPIQTKTGRTWIAGGDLKELSELHHSDEALSFAKSVSGFLDDLARLPGPVIIAIDGNAIGGGAELALGGDIRLATVDTRLNFKQTSLGLPTGFGGAARLCNMVGITRAESLIYGAQTIEAHKAVDWGLIHALALDEDDLTSLIRIWVKQLTSIDALAFASQKEMFYLARYGDPEKTRDAEARLFSQAWKNPTHRESLREFLEKSQNRS